MKTCRFNKEQELVLYVYVYQMRPLTLFLTSLVDTIAAKLVKCCDVHARLKLSSVFSTVFVSTPSVDHIPSPILHVQSEYTC